MKTQVFNLGVHSGLPGERYTMHSACLHQDISLSLRSTSCWPKKTYDYEVIKIKCSVNTVKKTKSTKLPEPQH